VGSKKPIKNEERPKQNSTSHAKKGEEEPERWCEMTGKRFLGGRGKWTCAITRESLLGRETRGAFRWRLPGNGVTWRRRLGD